VGAAIMARNSIEPVGPMRLSCLVLACVAAVPAVAAQTAAIELRPHASQWEVRYALPKPTDALRFVRVDRQGHRASSWTPVDPAFTIELEGGEEVVRRVDGKPFDHAAFRMAPRYVTLEKDYAPFAPFGDGGLLIHTGRFHVCAKACAGGESYAFSLQPPAGMHAIANGQVVASVQLDDGNEGTYLYVGRAVPVTTPDVVAVIDPTYPTDTRARLDALLPRLMAFYSGEFGVLKARPMLYASNDEAQPGGGYGYQGGTLPGQVFVHRYGRNPAFASPEFLSRQDWFFAHEAAHLYQHYPSLADEGDSWIHEGGADALAAVALQALGVIDRDAVQARLQAGSKECATGLEAHALERAQAEGASELFYSCGFVLQMAIDGAARHASQGKCGLACVWRDFQARVDAGAGWNGDTFIAAAEQRTDARTARFLRAVVDGKPPQPAELLQEGLERAGWGAAPATDAGR
jgi:hypothetical protein